MKREIKFRAFELKNPYDESVGQQMYYGVEDAYDTLGYMTNSKGKEMEYSWSSFGKVLDEVKEGNLALMQYTGLKDKNGKEIYERDIVEWEAEMGRTTIKMKDIITWDDAYTLRDSEEMETIEIIGNIYENPELIK